MTHTARMAVQSGTSAAIYTGNNSSVTPYPVPFPYLLAADIYVAIQQGEDDPVILAQGVEYTLTPTTDTNGNITGGSVVTAAPYDNTWTVTIFRQVSLTQLTELPEAGPISSRSLEKAYDKAVMALQQIHRRVLALEGFDDGGSVVVIPEGSTGSVLQDVQTFADSAARGNAIPKRVGQLGVQLDNGTLWQSNGPGSGAWERSVSLAKTLATTDSLSAILDVTGNTQGDILYRGASTWTRLAAGTSGQVLRTGGAGASPSWGNGKVVNIWRASTGTSLTTTSQIPIDNTIPQSSEGVEVLTITLTPSSASNFLIFLFDGYLWASATATPTAALFLDAESNARFAKTLTSAAGSYASSADFRAVIQAPSTASQTWRVRIGPNAAATFYIGRSASGDVYAGIDAITLTVMEVQP